MLDIRKVPGASVSSIAVMLSREFLKLVLLANLVSYYLKENYKDPKAVLFKVTGVIEVLSNLHFRIDFIAHFETFIAKEMDRRRLHYEYIWSTAQCGRRSRIWNSKENERW